jgi:hypothetical protein
MGVCLFLKRPLLRRLGWGRSELALSAEALAKLGGGVYRGATNGGSGGINSNPGFHGEMTHG